MSRYVKVIAGDDALRLLNSFKPPVLAAAKLELVFKLEWVLPRCLCAPPVITMEIYLEKDGQPQKIKEVHTLFAVAGWRLATRLGETLFDQQGLYQLKTKLMTPTYWDQHLVSELVG